ncbi:MAG: helix-turn-helix domain-containing protein, partial [Gemmatimonadota bacterium]
MVGEAVAPQDPRIEPGAEAPPHPAAEGEAFGAGHPRDVGEGARRGERGLRALQRLRLDEAARLLDISRDLAYDLIRRGELPAVKLGRRIVVPRHQLEVLL